MAEVHNEEANQGGRSTICSAPNPSIPRPILKPIPRHPGLIFSLLQIIIHLGENQTWRKKQEMVCFRIYGLEFWCPVWYLDSLRPNWKIKSDSGDRSVGRTWVVWPPNIVHSFLLKKKWPATTHQIDTSLPETPWTTGKHVEQEDSIQPGHPSLPGQPGVL